jgi:competence protein ComK
VYIVNQDTLYISFDGKFTVVNEQNTELVFEKDLINSILEESCIYYGSSYSGRIKGAKNILSSKYRLPVIISDNNELLFFPIKGAKDQEVIWFNFRKIKEFHKAGVFVEIIFQNDIVKKFMISYTVFNNQMLRCSRLWLVAMSR